MDFSLILLHIGGATMLLLWAVSMVRTAVEQAHGAALRHSLRHAKGGRVRAAGAGALLAIVLQSSTAVAILAAGFAASGILGVSTGLAMLLGADLGSALVVQALSFDLSWLVPVLLLVGGAMAVKFETAGIKQTGRILMGIAFVLLSLRMIGEATAPLRQSEFLPLAISYLRQDFVTAFVAAAVFTWLIHSSVAAILLFMTLATQGLLPIEVGLSFVLGANLGSGLIAVWLTRGQAEDGRRIPLGNLLFRAVAAIVALLAFQIFPLGPSFRGDRSAPARQPPSRLQSRALALVPALRRASRMAAGQTHRRQADAGGRSRQSPVAVRQRA